jgi:hypothetical protein
MSDFKSEWLKNNYPDDLIKEAKSDEFEEWLDDYEQVIYENHANTRLLLVSGFGLALLVLYILDGLLSIFGIDIFINFGDFSSNESKPV